MAQELDALFRRHHARLTRLCVRWTGGHRADAQDLLAEAYLKAVRASEPSSTLPRNLIAWVTVIIANLARDRQRARNRGADLVCLGDDELDNLCDPSDASDRVLATRQLLYRALNHVQRLCPAQRGALLARSAGEEYDAIAARLGTSLANVRKLVQTAREELRAELEPYAT